MTEAAVSQAQSGAPPLSPARRGNRKRALIFIAASVAVLALAQGILAPTQVNIYSSVLCAAATGAMAFYCLDPLLIEHYPLSTFALLGFAATNYAIPLAAQTFSEKPLVYNLLSPALTFNVTMEYQAVALAAHMLYTRSRTLGSFSQWIASRVLRPVWLFRAPSAGELWLLGVAGLGATWVSRILFVGEVHFGDVGGKFLQALVPFIVAPLFIPFRRYFLLRPELVTRKPTYVLLGIYVSVVVITAIAFNTRAIFAEVLLTAMLSFGLMLALKRIRISRRMGLLLAALTIAAPLVVHTAQNLATAMTIARGLRGSANYTQIMAETFRALGDPDELARFRAAELAKTSENGFSDYSEMYLGSEFLQRLTFTKYTDLTITASRQLTRYQRQAIQKLAGEQILSILPTPIIKLLNLDLNKADLLFSTGDVYADFAFDQTPGGERSGSSITNTMDVLGPLWPAVSFVLFVMTFILTDTYFIRHNGNPVLSPLSFIMLYQIFARGLIYDSFRDLVDGVSRAYVQAIVIFLVLSIGARLAVGLLSGRRMAPLAPTPALYGLRP